MAHDFLICPLCKYENPDGTRFCRKCGRLLIEPNQDASSTDRAPRYQAQELTAEPWRGDESAGITRAHVVISLYPDDFETTADATPTRLGEFLLGGRTVTVGRGQNCDIIFDKDTMVSRRHAILRPEGRHYTIADLGSSNGTFVNDAEIKEKTTIVHGDHILIGQHELLLLLDEPAGDSQTTPQPQTIIATVPQVATHAPADNEAMPASAPAPAADTPASEPVAETQVHATGAPATATTKYASVARLSSELAASASRMATPPKDSAELEEIRTRLIEASEALTRQASAQAALAERRRAAIVETRERVADLISDLRGDEAERDSPTHAQPFDLIALLERVAENPDNIEAVRALARHAGEIAQTLQTQGPTEGLWRIERANALRALRDIQLRLQERI